MNQKGFSQVILLGIIAVLVLAGAGGFLALRGKETPFFQETVPRESTEAIANKEEPETVIGESGTEPQIADRVSGSNPEKCPDGIWDAAEQNDPNLCPEDNPNMRSAAPRQTPPSQPSLPLSQPQQSQPQLQTQQPISQQPPQQQPTQEQISVKSTGSKYKTVSTKPTTGWFKTGQDADILLSGIDFNNTGGPLFFNHPAEIASDGARLLLADRNNNRVLIWNKLPTGNTPPDLVLGQPDFIQNNSGTGLNQFNWPSSVAAANGKVVVADTENHRILIWNTFPTRNAEPADLILDLPTVARNLASGDNFEWPWGVWTDGTKLAVTATHGSRVLIWNTFPTQNNQLPAVALSAQGKFGTPRGITSNGQYLIVGDHNARTTAGEIVPGMGIASATFVWKTWPSSNDQPYDFVLDGVRAGAFLPDNRLILLSTIHFPPSLWNSPPTGADDTPDVVLGNSAGGGGPVYYFATGDGSDIVAAGNRLYFSLANSNKIVVYNTVPSNPLTMPDFSIGSPDIYTNTLETNFMLGNPVVTTDGKSLFASSDFERKLYVWKNLPDESGADPDLVYSLPFAPWQSALHKNTLALAGRDTVWIWRKLPLAGEAPDVKLSKQIGGITFGDIRGVALDDSYFYLADDHAGKVYVWVGIPSADSKPLYTLDVGVPAGKISSNGKYLIVLNNKGGGWIQFYKILDFDKSTTPLIAGRPGVEGFRTNMPGAALMAGDRLLVADTGFGRILGWDNIDDLVADKNPTLILGANNINDMTQEIGRDKLFWPASMAFDGSFLWIGEFKFSSRLLRFSIK